MSVSGYERATEAFLRLLAEAGSGGQARVDAIVALSQRTVFVSTWAPLHEGFRTLVNASRDEALPIFTDYGQLLLAAERFGWVGQGGQVPFREIGARAAFQAIQERGMAFLVLDIASEHALEIRRDELEPLLSELNRRQSTGPFAAVGRVSSTMLEAASRVTPDPAVRPSLSSAPPPSDRVSPVPAPVVKEAMLPQLGVVASSDEGLSLTPVILEPPEPLLDALTTALKDYPEVEWASFCLASRTEADHAPVIGVRIDPAYRTHVNEIARSVTSVGAEHGFSLSLILLDDPSLLREARNEGLLFYPWKRRTRAPSA